MNKNKLNNHTTLIELITINAEIIAHDIRSPLSVIAMMIQQLTDCNNKCDSSVINQDAKNSLETMKLCVDKISNIINNSLKTINNTRQIYQGEHISNGFIFTHILGNLKNKLNYLFKPHELSHLHINIKNNFKYFGNPISMDQVITNLINNSLYQIRKNLTGDIFISSSEDSNFNYLHIKDTAGGVTKEITNKMFSERFTTKEDGNGIGLAFCKTTLKLFGGDITANLVDTDKIEFILFFPKTNEKDNN